MDKISLSNMKFLGYHGCEDFEKQKGQTFEVDVEFFSDLTTAGQTDRLEHAINYVDIFAKIKGVMENERHNLLERVAQRVADQVLEEPGIAEVIVRIRKPGVLLSGLLNWVQVEIRRNRQS